MAYNASIPQPNDQITKSQRDFLNNFESIYQLYGLDHVNLDASDQAGFHEKLTLVEQGSGPTTSSTESALYTKRDGSYDNLYVREESSGTEIQITDASAGHINIVPRPQVAAAWEYSIAQGGLVIPLGTWTNVTSVTTANIGMTFTITFTSALASNQYYVLGNYTDNTNTGNAYVTSVPTFLNYTTTSLDVQQASTGVNLGSPRYFIMVWL